jgi:SAM-dependent methyltransferase
MVVIKSEIVGMKNYYNIIADHFSQTRQYVWEDQKQFLDKIEANSRVLDLGCGNGRVLQILGHKNISYLGIDSSSSLIRIARTRFPDFTFQMADITDKKTFSGLKNYDYVLLFAVLHHVTDPVHQIRLFKNIKASLKVGGYLYLTVWNMYQTKYQNSIENNIVSIPYHLSDGHKIKDAVERQIFAFTPEDIKLLAEKAGFTVQDYYFSKKGNRTDAQNGYNLCFSLKK